MMLALLVALLAPPGPQAPARFELHAGWTCHTRSDCASGLAELNPGYRLRLTPRATVSADFALTLPHGVRGTRDARTAGGGGSVGWRWHLLPDRPLFDPFFELIGGVVVHAAQWPPGGSHYILRRGVALGLTLNPTPTFAISLGVRQQHLSNGQGLGPHNPSFDGLGAFLGVGVLPHAVNHPLPHVLDDDVLPSTRAVVQAQASLLEANGEWGVGLRAEGRVALTPGVWTQIRVDAGRLVGLDFVGGELDLAWQTTRGAVGLTGGMQLFAGLRQSAVAAQAEWYADRLSTIALRVGHRVATLAPAATDARLAWRVHPAPWLALDLGAEYTFDDRPDELDRIEPAVGFELAPPWLGDLGITLAVERQVDDLRVFSLRYTGGAATDLRRRYRAGGLQPLR